MILESIFYEIDFFICTIFLEHYLETCVLSANPVDCYVYLHRKYNLIKNRTY